MLLIREMQIADIQDIVPIHLSAFNSFFLTSMGASFLRVFYKAALLDGSSVALIALVDGMPAGFAVGTLQPSGFYRRVLQSHAYRFLIASILPILREPNNLLRLLRRLMMARQTDYRPGEAVLMSLAVDPARQTEGIGKKLVAGFLQEARQKGATSVSLTTDKAGNDGVNQFYINSGFSRAGSFITPEARAMNEYCKEL